MKIRTKLAKRLLIIAVVFFVLVGGAGGFYTYRKVTKRAQMEKARVEGLKAFADGDNQKAVDLLGNYIGYTRKPADDAMIAYAKVRPLIPLPQGEHLRQSIYVLRLLLEKKPDNELIEQRRELLDLYVKTQFWVEVGILADRLVPPPGKATPADAPVFAAKTKAAYAMGKNDDAIDNAWKWMALDPHDLEGQILLIELARRTGKYKNPSDKSDKTAGTTELAERLIAANYAGAATSGPATRSARDAARDAFVRGYAHYLYPSANEQERRVHRTEAIRQLHAAVDFDFHDRPIAEMFINVLDQLRDVDDAIAVLRRLDNEPGDRVTKDAVRARLVRRLFEAEDFKSVATLLGELEPEKPATDDQLMGIDALSELALGNKARTQAILAALTERGEKTDPTSGAKTDTLAAAWAQVVKSAASPESADALKVAAVCEKAIVGYKDPYLAFILGRIRADHQDRDAALSNWKNSAQWSTTWAKPLVYMAPVLSQLGRHSEAVGSALEGVLRAPHSVPAALTYMAVLDAAVDAGAVKDPSERLAAIERGEFGQFKDFDTFLCLHVNLLAAVGRTGDAAAAIDARLKTGKPPTLQALSRLLDISRKRQLAPQVSEIDDEIARNFGQTPGDALTKATALVAAGKPAEAVALFEKLQAAARDPQSLDWRLARAQCLDRASDPRAKDAVVRLAEAETGNLNVQLFAGEARATSSDREFLKRVETRVHELAGETTPWRVLSARNLLRFAAGPRDADFKRAIELLRQSVTDSPSNLDARLLLADALERSGLVGEAVEQMKAAVTVQGDSPQVVLQYAALLYRTGNTDAAHDQLVRLGKSTGSTPQTRFAAAAMALETRDHALALTLLNGVPPSTPAQTLLVARVDWANSRFADAEKGFQRLVEPPDAEPEALEAAAEFYASRLQSDKAAVLLDRIAADKRSPARAQYQLGRYWQKLAGPAKALEHYRLAVAADPALAAAWNDMIVAQFALGRPAEAVESIRKGADAPGGAHLAALARHADYFTLWDSAPETRRLLLDYVKGSDPDPDWLRQIVEKYKAGAKRAEIITLVDRLISSDDGKVQPLYTFAIELRYSLGRYREVEDWAVRTLSAFPDATEPQVILVRVLEEQKKWPQALTEARRWRQMSGAFTLEPDLAIARAYVQTGRAREAVSQLAPYVGDPTNAHELYLTVLPAYATAVRRNGTADVSSLMEPLLKGDSRSRIAYMQFAVTEMKDDPARAAAWLDRAAAAIPPGAADDQLMLASAWRDLYTASPQKPAGLLAKALAVLEPLTRDKELAPAALLQMAVTQELQDPAAAEAAYRRVLAIAHEGTVAQLYAMNNLAMLLAKTGGNLNEAGDLARSAVKLQPKLGATNDTLAVVEMKRGNYRDALPSAQTALENRPRNVEFIVRVAKIDMELGNVSDAKKVLKTIQDLEIDTSDLPDDLKKQLSEVRASVEQAPKASETQPK